MAMISVFGELIFGYNTIDIEEKKQKSPVPIKRDRASGFCNEWQGLFRYQIIVSEKVGSHGAEHFFKLGNDFFKVFYNNFFDFHNFLRF